MASTAAATGFVSLVSLAASRPGAAQSVVGSYGGGGLVEVRVRMRLRRAVEVAVMLPAVSRARRRSGGGRVRGEEANARIPVLPVQIS